MTLVSGESALAEFRAGLNGPRGMELLSEHDGRVLIQWPIGVGKSQFLDEVTVEAVAGGHYDLAVVLCPTRRLVEERRPLREPPPGVRVVNLRPRPAQMCGTDRVAQWREFERADLGALGREEICGHCPLVGGCFWPGQYGKSLSGAGIVYATQAHIERAPGFLVRLRSWAGAERVLTLFDESNFLAKQFEGQITAEELDRFLDSLHAANEQCDDPRWDHGRWVELVELLREASTLDLQAPEWRMPLVFHDWAAAVQRIGVERHGGTFRFLAYRLAEFGLSPIETRLKCVDGTVSYGIRPYVDDCMIFSGTTDARLAGFRLGQKLASPFADFRFSHPGTRWYNIASPIGTRRHFLRHAPQVLDFIAALTARRVTQGKRVLLVGKKCFVQKCATGMRERLGALGVDLQVETGGWTEESLSDPRAVPLIHYGTIGTNLFEHFDCAYCLCGYYVDVAVVDRCLQDLTRQDLRLKIQIVTTGDPRRRRAGVADQAHSDYDVAWLAQAALEFKEHAVVEQAVGRVRPYTKPREIITFQMGEFPGVRYDAEFRTLAEARRFFDITAGGKRRRAERAARVVELRRQGLTQAKVAEILGISVRTVRTYEQENRQKLII